MSIRLPVYQAEELKAYSETAHELFITEREKSLKIIKDQWSPGDQQSIKSEATITPTPPILQIGLVKGICDLRCPQCWIPSFVKDETVKKHFMEWPLYKKIIDQVTEMDAAYNVRTAIRYLGSGESLLDPDLIEKISYAKQKLKGAVALITNGQKLNSFREGKNQTLAQELLDTRIDLIDISIDATNNTVYQKVRGDQKHTYEQLAKNVLSLITLRNSGHYTTTIMGSFLIQPENYHQGHAFVETWGSLLDQYILRKYHSYRGHIAAKPLASTQGHKSCAAPFGRLNITSDGKVTACYLDWLEEEVVGDLNQPGGHIIDSWQQGMRPFQEAHLSGKKPDFCNGCDGYAAAHHGSLAYEVIIKNATSNLTQPRSSEWNEVKAYSMIVKASE